MVFRGLCFGGFLFESWLILEWQEDFILLFLHCRIGKLGGCFGLFVGANVLKIDVCWFH